MKKLYKKLRCWIWGHIYYVDGPSGDFFCVECGEEL
jgi:hypothetical protein